MRNLCIGCGCDEDHACISTQAAIAELELGPTCCWLRFDAKARAGVCSECEDVVALWEKGARAPQLELIASRFYRQAYFLYQDKASALAWVASPQLGIFGGKSARDLILAGRIDEVHTVLDQLRSGAYV